MSGDHAASVIYLTLILVALGGWALVEYRARLGEMARIAAAWAMIFVAVAAGYGLWGDLRRDAMAMQTVERGRVVIGRAGDGHYYLDLMVNDRPITMMADTGASGIVLSQQDARSVGVDLEALRYLGRAMTANGSVRTARVSLERMVLGPFVDENVTAFVTQGQMEGSLLGMDYLGRFDISLVNDQMELARPN